MTIQLYGISNCSTVKKARVFLEEHGIAYQFNDFKKTPPDTALLTSWLEVLDLATLINKRGTTWRKLTETEQAQALQQDSAIALMQAYPSIIKRPVLVSDAITTVGFQEANYTKMLIAE